MSSCTEPFSKSTLATDLIFILIVNGHITERVGWSAFDVHTKKIFIDLLSAGNDNLTRSVNNTSIDDARV